LSPAVQATDSTFMLLEPQWTPWYYAYAQDLCHIHTALWPS